MVAQKGVMDKVMEGVLKREEKNGLLMNGQ